MTKYDKAPDDAEAEEVDAQAFHRWIPSYWQKSTVRPGKFMKSKKPPKNSGQKLASPHFGSNWRPNC